MKIAICDDITEYRLSILVLKSGDIKTKRPYINLCFP